MSKPDEFPQPKGADNTKAGIETRKEKLLKEKKERQLFDIFERLYPFNKEKYMLAYFEPKEWDDFFQKFIEIIKTLLSLDPFEDNQTLKTECQEVLISLDTKDTTQSKKYSDLIEKLYIFLTNQNIFTQSKLP